MNEASRPEPALWCRPDIHIRASLVTDCERYRRYFPFNCCTTVLASQ